MHGEPDADVGLQLGKPGIDGIKPAVIVRLVFGKPGVDGIEPAVIVCFVLGKSGVKGIESAVDVGFQPGKSGVAIGLLFGKPAIDISLQFGEPALGGFGKGVDPPVELLPLVIGTFLKLLQRIVKPVFGRVEASLDDVPLVEHDRLKAHEPIQYQGIPHHGGIPLKHPEDEFFDCRLESAGILFVLHTDHASLP